MTWTYNLEDLATSEKDQVRLEIGDTNPDDQLLQDEEILQFITVERNFWGVCARCCEQAARVFLRKSDIRLGRVLYLINANSAKQYLAMAQAMRTKALGTDVPWIGGMNVADKEEYAQDSSLVQPAFTRRMMADPWVGELGSDTDVAGDLPIGP